MFRKRPQALRRFVEVVPLQAVVLLQAPLQDAAQGQQEGPLALVAHALPTLAEPRRRLQEQQQEHPGWEFFIFK